MSGIYIHIPFCASRCIYCDFYSTTFKNEAVKYVNALIKEYNERKSFLPEDSAIQTIYVGGGTPSQIPVSELSRLLKYLLSDISLMQHKHSDASYINELSEVTIEANPEDVTAEWAETLCRINNEIEDIVGTKILRISLGVQSLCDDELRLLNRRHDSQKPYEAVRLLRNAGIENISLDLMYGLPLQSIMSWKKSIDGIIELNPEHISAYCLSIEEGTKMERMVKEGKLSPADDDLCLEMAAFLREKLSDAGYHQYEISNYCKPGFESKHNSNYWNGTPYLGLGPGAHSYDGARLRVWNECNLLNYLSAGRTEGSETLSDEDLYNERIMLSLRTAKGIDLRLLSNSMKQYEVLRQKNYLKCTGGFVSLTTEGLALADQIIRELMI